MIVDETKRIIDKYEVYPKKGYGQNFLINKGIIEKIVQTANLTKEDYVIEIGPGLGSLSEYLCLNAKKVICFEIDELMVKILKETLSQYDNVLVVEGDFLKQDVKKYISEHFEPNAKVKVVANLPYYITTPILSKLLKIDNIIEETFMVQKEMGERFIGKVNTKDYNALSVFMQYYTNTTKAFIVGKNNFYPIPNIDSIVLNAKFLKKDLGIKDDDKFMDFVKASFAQRRKTMINNLSNFYKISKSKLEIKFKELGFDPNVRSESLDLNELAKAYLNILGE